MSNIRFAALVAVALSLSAASATAMTDAEMKALLGKKAAEAAKDCGAKGAAGALKEGKEKGGRGGTATCSCICEDLKAPVSLGDYRGGMLWEANQRLKLAKEVKGRLDVLEKALGEKVVASSSLCGVAREEPTKLDEETRKKLALVLLYCDAQDLKRELESQK